MAVGECCLHFSICVNNYEEVAQLLLQQKTAQILKERIQKNLFHLQQVMRQIAMIHQFRSSPPGVFLGKGVLKICSKFAGEHPCRSAISIKLQSNFIEITLRYGCSSVNLLHFFRIPFLKNTPGGLLLSIDMSMLTHHETDEENDAEELPLTANDITTNYRERANEFLKNRREKKLSTRSGNDRPVETGGLGGGCSPPEFG